MENNLLNTIYVLKNVVNSKIYIGQTWKSLKKRWRDGSGYKGSIYLENAIKKYGKDNFYYEVLTFCGTQETANYWETYFIEKYKSNNSDYGYNLKNGGSNGKHSVNSIQKMSLAKIGKQHNEESKLKVSVSLLGNKRGIGNKNHLGHKHSESARNKMSQALKGRSAPNKGKVGLRGEDNPKSKVTEKIVLDIRKDFASQNYSQVELSKKYNLSTTIINRIVSRKTWSHI